MDHALTLPEKAFISRMAIHAAAGMSFDDAARAVLADDQRIMATLDANRAVRQEVTTRMASTVWNRVRAADHTAHASRAWSGA